MPERPYNDRVDDTILVGAWRLSRLRDKPLRSMVEGHMAQCYENARDSLDTAMHDYWHHRIVRCEAILQEPSDEELRKRARDALIREEKG